MIEMENAKPEKDSSWGSENITFNGEEKTSTQPIEKIDKEGAVKHSPESNEEDKILHDSTTIKIKNTGKYTYLEKNGVDSVAFVLVAINASDERRIGLLSKYQEPIRRIVTTAFESWITENKHHEDLRELVKDKSLEYSGFDVKIEILIITAK